MLRLWICCIVGFSTFVARSEELEIGYSFRRSNRGGLAIATIDGDDGKILRQEVKYESHHCPDPKKVRPVGDGKTFLLTHANESRPFVFIVDTQDPQLSRQIELPGMPDEVRIAGTQAIVTCAKDHIATIDIVSGRVLAIWDVSDELNPPGNHPQDILITPDAKHAIISFQKDSPGGKKLGGRLAVFALPGMDVVADVLLGRDYEGWKLANKIRKTGPGLELIFLDEENDTILSSSDHYGAVALLRWSELQAGKLKDLEYRSTAFDKSWGHSFPDRGTQFVHNGKSYCLICNAGSKGGSVIVDLQSWEVVRRMQTRFGLEKPEFVPQLKRAFSTCPGKHKVRKRKEIVKTYRPQPVLTVFELDGGHIVKTKVREIPHCANLFQIGVLKRERKLPLLVLTSGKTIANRIIVFDPSTETILDSKPTIGSAIQFEKG